MIFFGLTGGIASGKSTVAGIVRGMGIPVVDADQVARDVVVLGTDGHRRVVEAFGASVLLPDGGIDRKALGAIVFGDADARRRLNGILHPAIAAETASRAAEIAAAGHAVACYEAALLVENGLADAFRPLCVVAVPVDVQISRCMERDGLTAAEARARIDAQMPLAEKVAAADYVIDNAGTLAETEARTRGVVEAIRASGRAS